MSTVILESVVDELKALPYELQWRVLEFTRSLATTSPRGVAGKSLLRFAGVISMEDLKLISETINQGCEQVDASEW